MKTPTTKRRGGSGEPGSRSMQERYCQGANGTTSAAGTNCSPFPSDSPVPTQPGQLCRQSQDAEWWGWRKHVQPKHLQLQFGSHRLEEALRSSKQLVGDKTSWVFLFAFMPSISVHPVFGMICMIFILFPLSSNSRWSGKILWGSSANGHLVLPSSLSPGAFFSLLSFVSAFLQSHCPCHWNLMPHPSSAEAGNGSFPSFPPCTAPACLWEGPHSPVSSAPILMQQQQQKLDQLWTYSSGITLSDRDRQKAREKMLKLISSK